MVMTITEAITLATELKNQHFELRTWSVTLHNRKRSFGTCNHLKKEIQLSRLLIPTMTDAGVKDTIIHEIAHALTKGHGHDYTWKRKCIELGGNGQRLGGIDKFIDGKNGIVEFNKIQSKYVLTCPVCGHKYYKHRKPTQSLGCGKHGGGYNPMYELVLTQNY
jgi:predicted SprT family Zn-dependent metalloprotease